MKLHIIFLFLILSLEGFAADIFSLENFSVRINGGVLQSTSNEIVYRNSASPIELSELIWENNINLAGIGATLEPSEYLRFNMDLYFNINEGSGTLDDYDWMDFNIDDWTHWSHHSTRTTVILWDFNTELLALPLGDTTVFLTAGYKYDYLESTAYDGSFVYSSAYDEDGGGVDVGGDSSSGFRDIIRNNVDLGDGITYKQYYSSPYVGLGAIWDKRYYSINGRVIYSSMVDAIGEDMHHLRNLYNEFSTQGTLLGATLKATYKITSDFFLNASYEYEMYDLERANLTQTYTDTGVSSSGSGGGMKHSSSVFTVGIEYKY